MVNKITNISVLALTAALASSGAFAHSGKYISDTWGKRIVDSDGECILSNSGVDVEGCEPEMKPAPAPVVEPKPAPAPVMKSPSKPDYQSSSEKPVLQKVVKKLSLAGDATFGSNSAELTDAGKASLDKLVSDLAKADVASIALVGHADSRGNDDYNMALSERRANSVKAYLVAKGIDASIISATGRGETQPIATNETAEGRAKNRRVDVAITADQTEYK